MTSADLQKVCDAAKRWCFVALSYRWLSREHPDPDAYHLTVISFVLKTHLKFLSRYYEVDDVGIFWDFASLYHKPKGNREKELFEAGLAATSTWFGSSQTLVWLQPQVPEGFKGTKFADSGWCFVEGTISAAIKDGNLRWDLGHLKLDNKGKVLDESVWWDDLSAHGKKCRMVPLRPDKVAELLQRHKKFTLKADIKKATTLYDNFFAAVSSAPCLSFPSSGWTSSQMHDLVDVLPQFSMLEVLDLAGNRLGDEGVKVLARALKANDTVARLDLARNMIGNEGAMALADTLKANDVLTNLSLGENCISSEGAIALADALKVNTAMSELDLYSNNIGEWGAVALADAVKAWRVCL